MQPYFHYSISYITFFQGLKELRRLIDEVAFDDVRKSFKHFVALFPKLALDTTATVRSNVVRVLGDYIKKLQKNCEPYLKKVRIFHRDIVLINAYK